MDSTSRLRGSSWTGDLIARVRAIDPHAIDALVALALAGGAMLAAAGQVGDEGEFRDVDAIGIGLLLLQTLPLAVRRLAPVGVLAVIATAVFVHSALGYESVQAGTFGSLVAVYGAASLTDNRRGLLAAGITAASLAGFFATNRQDFGAVNIFVVCATWAMGWFVGTYVRIRGEQAQAAGELAESLERDQELRAREAVADERLRMARELHDIVGHALNLIVIQSQGAQRVFESKPQAARDSLKSIESAGREALSDMERMLGVLRGAEAGGQSLDPQPGLQQVQALAAQVSEAGLPVEVRVEGRPADLPASVELSAYRIVQEALTNALKHSGASRGTVTVRYGEDSLEVEVADNGRGPSQRASHSDRGGRGLIGMRERVAMFGGDLSVGPAPAGGYRVHARLPLKTAAG